MTLPTDSTEWRAVHRVVLPADGDPMTLPLYLDERVTISNPEAGDSEGHGLANQDEPSARRDGGRSPSVTFVAPSSHSMSRASRFGARFAGNSRVSFATFFNAFPASYWRQWTNAEQVRLVVELEGSATVHVFRSNVRGTLNRVVSENVIDGRFETIVPLTTFGDGGWLWFDLEAGSKPIRLVGASWQVEESAAVRRGTAAISITTYNRPADCVEQMRRVAGDASLLDRIDRLLIVDQGSQRVADEPGFEMAAQALGSQFELIEQANLGGSGGFARGMYETSRADRADYVILLDDDVVLETEGARRAIDFADFTRIPTIVGGHMISLYERSVLHSAGERVNLFSTSWGPVEPSLERFDFSAKSIRSSALMNRRIDVDYNGWWMCLIPTSVVREIGLSLPLFIKWDDAEYGLRAKSAGYPTVTLPGSAVWHVPWTEKDDGLDWQAYHHQRNRWLVGLLYSPYRRGGALWRTSLLMDLKHLLSLQYSVVTLRQLAIDDLLSGPAHLHATMGKRAAEARRIQAGFPDGSIFRKVSEYPSVHRQRPPRGGEDPKRPTNAIQTVTRAATALAAHLFRKPTAMQPEVRVAAPDARWWRLSGFDALLVSTADGSGVREYRRDRKTFRRLLSRSIQQHSELRRRWPEIARDYKRSMPDLVSEDEWERTFGLSGDERPS